MKKEYIAVTIIGLFLLAYVLEAVVDPLILNLATPYEFLSPTYFSKFPFSSATIIIRALAIFMSPLFLFSFISGARLGKGGFLIVASALIQLYAIQEVTSGTTLVPLEWSISLAISGLALLIPATFNLLLGIFAKKPVSQNHQPPINENN